MREREGWQMGRSSTPNEWMAHRIQWAQRANLFESLAVSFTWFVEIFGRDG
jgi:hypothetical protein